MDKWIDGLCFPARTVLLVGVVFVAASALAACATNDRGGNELTSAARNDAADSGATASATPADSKVADGEKAGEREQSIAPPPSNRSAGNNLTPAQAADPLLARGETLFKEQCVICHGEKGDGAGKFAYLMNPRPRDFQKGNFKIATTQNQIPTEADLIRTISRGMPGSAMPPWGHLPKSDLLALIRYVRRIRFDAAEDELRQAVSQGRLSADRVQAELAARTQPGPPLVIPPEPGFDDLHWFRGRSTYLEACAACHGVDGNPVPEAVKYDSDGYPVPPRSFVNGIFKGGSEGHQLYARILKGLRGTPMPAYEGTYTDDELWDLIHYVQSLARVGAQERAQMRQGTFVAPRVEGDLPDGPLDSAWDQARPLYVALTPLWWTEKRIEGLRVQAMHNGSELALRFAWIDPTRNERAVRQTEFRDGVAIQFSLSSNPPFYMGDSGEHGGVNIWFWKADRQKDLADGYQDVDTAYPQGVVSRYAELGPSERGKTESESMHAPITAHDPTYITAWGAGNLVADPKLGTSVESLVAQGPGTLAGKPAGIQMARGQAVYQRGVWYVQMQRTLDLPHGDGPRDERVFRPGDYLPVSFAVFNGDTGDRDGKKNISIWQKLVIE